MACSQTPVPEAISRSIVAGRYGEAADALFWITPDSANLEPGTGGLDVWDVAAPADWTFEDYNVGSRDIHAFLRQEGARQTSFAYAENRALLFRGTIFHQTAAMRFAEGFENRRRNVTMLFRRTRS